MGEFDALIGDLLSGDAETHAAAEQFILVHVTDKGTTSRPLDVAEILGEEEQNDGER